MGKLGLALDGREGGGRPPPPHPTPQAGQAHGHHGRRSVSYGHHDKLCSHSHHPCHRGFSGDFVLWLAFRAQWLCLDYTMDCLPIARSMFRNTTGGVARP